MAQTAEQTTQTRSVRFDLQTSISDRVQKYRSTILAKGNDINFTQALNQLLDKALLNEGIIE